MGLRGMWHPEPDNLHRRASNSTARRHPAKRTPECSQVGGRASAVGASSQMMSPPTCQPSSATGAPSLTPCLGASVCSAALVPSAFPRAYLLHHLRCQQLRQLRSQRMGLFGGFVAEQLTELPQRKLAPTERP